MPDGPAELPAYPSQVEVIEYIDSFCRQLDYGIGSDETLVRLKDKPETRPAMEAEDDDFMNDSPAYQTLRFLLGMKQVPMAPPSPWDPEPLWMKEDRLDGRPEDTSLG